MESPYCSPEAAQWLIDRGAKAVGFDCFSEYCARLPDFTSEDFIIHKVILENGSILMQQLTNFSLLPIGRRFQFFAPFIKIRGAEGSPARFFALLDCPLNREKTLFSIREPSKSAVLAKAI